MAEIEGVMAEAGWEQLLRTALAPLNLPCAALSYGGSEADYLVFNGNEIPVNYSDNEPQNEQVLIQLHLYTTMTENTRAISRAIKRAVRGAGFSYPTIIHTGPRNTNESDGVGQHIVYEFEWVQAAEV